jgi:hypothetical protein
MGLRHVLRQRSQPAHLARVVVCVLGLGEPTTADAAPLPPASVPSVVLGVPQFAKVEGDATGVNLAWWAAKGAAQYEVMRAADPRGTASVRSTLAAGTLGYRDTLPAIPPAYFALVAIGADGARSTGAWAFVNTPSIGAIEPGAAGVVITWSTVQPPPAGFEIWRTADPQQPGIRVGSVASGITTFTDHQPATGTTYYQIAALGGGARAASNWVASTAAPASSGVAPMGAAPGASLTAGTGMSACGCPGELLQKIATLQNQVDTLTAALAVDAAHSMTLTASRDMLEQVGGSQSTTVALDRSVRVARDDSLTVGGGSVTSIGKSWQLTGAQAVQLNAGTGISLQVKNARYAFDTSDGNAYLPGNWTETVGRDRTANVGRNDSLKIGMGAVTSVGTDWDLTAAQAIALKAGKQISLNSGLGSVQVNPDGSVAISGTKLSVSATGDLQLVSGGTMTINGTKWVAGSAGAIQGLGINNHPASSGTGAPCTLGDVSLTAAVIGNGTPADGRTLPIVGNQALFALLGTNFGGDGKSTFALPDLRALAPNGLTYMICTQGVFPKK